MSEGWFKFFLGKNRPAATTAEALRKKSERQREEKENERRAREAEATRLHRLHLDKMVAKIHKEGAEPFKKFSKDFASKVLHAHAAGEKSLRCRLFHEVDWRGDNREHFETVTLPKIHKELAKIAGYTEFKAFCEKQGYQFYEHIMNLDGGFAKYDADSNSPSGSWSPSLIIDITVTFNRG